MDSKYQPFILGILLLLILFSVYSIFFTTDSSDTLIILETSEDLTEPISNTSTETLETQQSVYSYEEALMSGDLSTCDLIIDSKKQNLCKSKLGICDSDDCIYSKALESSNQNECYNITDETLKLKCSYETFKTSIFDSAVLENDIDLCNQLEDESLNQRCKDNFNFVSSINLNDISYCDKIIQSDLKEVCYNEN
jgi:hypothetical protein